MRYLIWSQKHDQWWGPDRAGYTPDTLKAGQYTPFDAADVVMDSFPPGSNIAVIESLSTTFLEMRDRNGGAVVTAL